MATTRFNNHVLSVARRLNDPRTDASATGDTGAVYSSAILSYYVNQAMRDLVRDYFLKLGEQATAAIFPDLVKVSSALTLTTGSVAVPTDSWFITALRVSGGTKEFRKIHDVRDINRAITGEHAFIKPTAAKPYFYELGGTINTLGITTGNVLAHYMTVPPDVTVVTGAGGTDMILNSIWDGEIVDRAVAKAVQDSKHAIAKTLG